MAERAAKGARMDLNAQRDLALPSTSDTEEFQEGQEQGQEFNILATPDETSDVILVVEGRELHANRGALAHFSPVFRRMFFAEFKEKSAERVALPGKKHSDMVMFFNVLLSPTSTSKGLLSDENLRKLLTLADEYHSEHVKAVCQDYIGGQVGEFFRNFYNFHTAPTGLAALHRGYPLREGSMLGQKMKRRAMIEKLLLYLQACCKYQLQAHCEDVESLLIAVTKSADDLMMSRNYQLLSTDAKLQLSEKLCKKLSEFHRQSNANSDDDSEDESLRNPMTRLLRSRHGLNNQWSPL